MACAGKIGEFDSANEDWESYVERVELYCIANDVEDEKKVATLLSLMGAKTYHLLRNLLAPEKPASQTFKKIEDTLKNHLSPKPLVIAERFRFHNRNQARDESISEYIAELRRLTQFCEFGAGLNDALRDRLVCGMHCQHTQKRLLSEKDLTLEKALAIAVSMETAARDALELQKKGVDSGVHKMSMNDDKRYKCYRCGKTSHDAKDCWFKDKNCRKCNKPGHIERVCRQNTERRHTQREKPHQDKMQKRKAKHVYSVTKCESGSETESDTNGLACLELHSITEEDRKIIWITPDVSGVKLKMELDTGSALSIISVADYKRLFPNLPLIKTSVRLKTYTGQSVFPKGKLSVKVTYRGETRQLKLYVLKRGGPPLFGREWLRKIQLDWRTIKALYMPPKGNRSSHHVTQKLSQLLKENEKVFAEGIGTLKGIKAKIELDRNATPRFHKARPVPYALRPKVDAELESLVASGILSRVEWSDWATPIVPVSKKGKADAIRICGDFKVSINPVLHTVQYPLPRIEDIFASLAGGEKFSKIDLAQAYLQMEVEDSSRKFLTINTHKGLFQYNRLVFGVASAPAMWQRAMDQVLQGIPGTQCYLDDIIVTGKDDEEHLQNLSKVLTRLREYGLRAKRSKCEFFKSEISYCGHVIDKHGLHKSQEKIEAVIQAPKPENVSQLRSYLGLVNYYHKFLPNLATTLHPLNALLQTGVRWKWSEECDAAFKETKRLITSDELLTHYDPTRPIRLACDASPYGIGCVLSHSMEDGSERPIAFASRSLTSAERNYAQIDREALSLVWGIKKFHHYLYGQKFTLVTDHQPLLSIFNPRKGIPVMSATRLQRWALFLGAHTYDIEFKGTKQHCNADGLSRLPLSTPEKEKTSPDAAEVFHTAVVDQLPVSNAEIQRHTRNDPTLSKVYDITMKGWPAHGDPRFPEFSVRRDQLSTCQGTLLCGSRVVVPSKLRTRVLENLHEGHLGTVKMKSLARSYVWWPGIDKQIEDITKNCSGCHRVQNEPPRAPLHPWEWPSAPWQRVHIDFAGPFMNHMFLIVVDAHSKWPEVILMKSTTSEKTVTALRSIFSRNGLPEQIVSDNGPQYTSDEFSLFMKKNGIKHFKSAPHHPATNGLAERFVQTFKKSIKAMEKEDISLQHKIDKFLFTYRNSVHATTNQTPAMLFMNRNLRSRMDLLKPDLRRNVQNKQFSHLPSKAARNFEIGQEVLARDYREEKWTPGRIATRTGPLTYTVDVGERTWRRHVDQILDAQPTNTNSPSPDVPLSDAHATDSNMTSTETLVPDKTPDNCDATPKVQRRYPERHRAPPKRLDL